MHLATRQEEIVKVDHPQPDLRYDLAHGTGDDPYDGPMDRFGRVTDLLWRDYGSSTDAVRIQHGYDRAGNRLWREDPVAAANGVDLDEYYAYDGMSQLAKLDRGDLNAGKTGITGTPAWEEDWTLDATGNWSGYVQKTSGTTDLNQSRTHNEVNEITDITETVGDSWITPTHDRNGNALRIMQPNDPESYYTLTWDAWNRLVKVEDGEDTVAEYSYDGRNFRIVKKTYTGGQLDETRHFYYNSDWQCLEERLETAGQISSYANRQYVWGLRYIDDLILRDRNADNDSQTGDLGKTNSGLEERLYTLQDPNWNVVAVADTNGDIQERYSYHAYGTPLFLAADFTARNPNSSSYAWEYVFTARRYDPETGLMYYRMRRYGPELGRFPTQDPIGPGAGEVNPYLALGNAPTVLLDPFGLWAQFGATGNQSTEGRYWITDSPQE